MKISRFAKAVLYLMLTAILLSISIFLQVSMHKADGLEEAYFKSNTFLFITAAVCMGIAIYSYRSYTRHHKEHTGDSLFFLVTGLILMVCMIVLLINFGGLDDTFTKSGYIAANANIILLTVLPAPFLIRSFVLACCKRKGNVTRYRIVTMLCGVAAVAYVLALAFGGMMRMVYYDENINQPQSYSGASLDNVQS